MQTDNVFLEVAQQSKARKKEDFLIAFSPIIAEASGTAYKGATNEVQQKLRRVIEVWRQRQIFDTPIQLAVEARIDGKTYPTNSHGSHSVTSKLMLSLELDKSRSSSKKPLGGSLFSTSGPSAPAELQPLFPLQISVTKATASTNGAATTADMEYEKLTDPSKTIPTPPVHAARLSALLKSLATAEGAVSESIKARRALIVGLESILETNRTALASEEAQHIEFSSRKGIIEAKKREVEDSIMRGLSAESSPTASHSVLNPDSRLQNGKSTPQPHDNSSTDIGRSQVRELSPPPVESLTPVGSPRAAAHGFSSSEPGPALIPNQTPNHTNPAQVSQPSLLPTINAATPGSDLLSSLSMPPVRHYAGSPGAGNAFKKRKLEQDYAGFGAGEDAMADLDDDVAELLRAESGGH